MSDQTPANRDEFSSTGPSDPRATDAADADTRAGRHVDEAYPDRPVAEDRRTDAYAAREDDTRAARREDEAYQGRPIPNDRRNDAYSAYEDEARAARREDEARAARREDEAYEDRRVVDDRRTDAYGAYEDEARARFGGANWGACFFGWLVAIAVAILLTSIVGAVVTAVGSSTDITQSEAERQAGKIGLAAAIVLVIVLALGYYLGGYVAGRMSRFDGGHQGFGVWLIGLIVTIVAIALGAIFGNQYDVLNRVSLPNLPISTDKLGWSAVITALAVLVLTLICAVVGGKVGHRYHDRVDRAAWGA